MLAGEPWCMTPEQIGRLDPRVVQQLYFHPRKKDGSLDLPGESLSEEEFFLSICRSRGYSQEEAAAKWKAQPKRPNDGE